MLNALQYQKAQFLNIKNQNENVLNLEAFRHSKKKMFGHSKNRIKIIKNRFHNFIREKEFKIISVSL